MKNIIIFILIISLFITLHGLKTRVSELEFLKIWPLEDSVFLNEEGSKKEIASLNKKIEELEEKQKRTQAAMMLLASNVVLK